MSAAMFSLLESPAGDGVVELRPIGELDLAVADQFSRRLAELVGGGARVRLDLSQLQFIDSAGIHALIRAVMDGGGDGGHLVVVDRNLTRSVRKVIELVGAAPTLWSAGDGGL